MPIVVEGYQAKRLLFCEYFNLNCPAIKSLWVHNGSEFSRPYHPIVAIHKKPYNIFSLWPLGFRDLFSDTQAIISISEWHYNRLIKNGVVTEIGRDGYAADRNTPQLTIYSRYFDTYIEPITQAIEKYEQVMQKTNKPCRVIITKEYEVQ